MPQGSTEHPEDPAKRPRDSRYYAQQHESREEAEAQRNDSSGFDSPGSLLDGPAARLPGIVGEVFEGSRQRSAGSQSALHRAGEAGAGWFRQETRPSFDRVRSQAEPVTDAGQQISEGSTDCLGHRSDRGLRRPPGSQAGGKKVDGQGHVGRDPGTAPPISHWLQPTQGDGDAEGDDRCDQQAQREAEEQQRGSRGDSCCPAMTRRRRRVAQPPGEPTTSPT